MTVKSVNNISQLFKTLPVKELHYRPSFEMPKDTVSFTGASVHDYDTNYDAYCTKLARYKGSFSSPKDFSQKAEAKYTGLKQEIILPNGELSEKYRCDLEWPIGVSRPKHMPITDSRKQILKEWIDFLENPVFENRQGEHSGENEEETTKALEEIKNNPSLKLIILETMLTDIKRGNKHISPPLNAFALSKTVLALKNADRSNIGAFSFLNNYRNNLIDLVLERAQDSSKYSPRERKGMIETFPYNTPNLKGVWVKVPSYKHNKHNFTRNVRAVEIISHENWCTKNAVYKAEASISEGDFYVFLEEQKNHEYKPTIGMALCGTTIFQIQNPQNNDIVNHKYLPVVDFIKDKQGLEFDFYQRDDGIPAGRQYEITSRLKEIVNGKTLETAIKENDAETIFSYAGIEYTKDENGMLVLEKYRPKILIKKGQVPPITFYEMGIDEYALLSKVSGIKGNAEFENSAINDLPESIKSVGKRISARPKQFSEKCKSRFNTRWIETDKSRLRPQ
ncbi:hypothetical protein IKQ26_03810 [bacterium]|nr:hypothetical protein [bacterium]